MNKRLSEIVSKISSAQDQKPEYYDKVTIDDILPKEVIDIFNDSIDNYEDASFNGKSYFHIHLKEVAKYLTFTDYKEEINIILETKDYTTLGTTIRYIINISIDNNDLIYKIQTVPRTPNWYMYAKDIDSLPYYSAIINYDKKRLEMNNYIDYTIKEPINERLNKTKNSLLSNLSYAIGRAIIGNMLPEEIINIFNDSVDNNQNAPSEDKSNFHISPDDKAMLFYLDTNRIRANFHYVLSVEKTNDTEPEFNMIYNVYVDNGFDNEKEDMLYTIDVCKRPKDYNIFAEHYHTDKVPALYTAWINYDKKQLKMFDYIEETKTKG